MKSLTVALVALCAINLYLCETASSVAAAEKASPQLTSTLVAWISSQCEMIVEEMEAILKYNSKTSGFSLVSYLRYMNLYNELKVVSSKNIDELKWVSKKVRAFAKTYLSAFNVVAGYLVQLDETLRNIEKNEPKSKQVSVSQAWVNIYETIRYIATHVSTQSCPIYI